MAPWSRQDQEKSNRSSDGQIRDQEKINLPDVHRIFQDQQKFNRPKFRQLPKHLLKKEFANTEWGRRRP